MSKILISSVFLVALAAYIIFRISKPKNKKVTPFPPAWHKLLIEHVDFYKDLEPLDQKRFQHRLMLFLDSTYIESIDFEISALDKLLVASSAIIPVFGFKSWNYSNLSTVLLYPDHFNRDLVFADGGKDKIVMGLVGTGRFEHQMILSRKALHQGFDKKDRLNTGIHEFIHLIDKIDGVTDGVPERLIKQAYVVPWLKLVHKEMEAINANKSDIRSYGGTNEAEFLATAAEYFFENPEKMRKKHPELFKMLESCFFPEKDLSAKE